jgi:hypothetical protein
MGIIKPILRTKNELYIPEKDISAIAKTFSQSRGRGKRTIINEFKRKETLLTM